MNHCPLPNDQFQLVGEFVEVSLNWTASGAVPVVLSVMKLATGAAWETVIAVPGSVVLEPPALATMSFTVNVPGVLYV